MTIVYNFEQREQLRTEISVLEGDLFKKDLCLVSIQLIADKLAELETLLIEIELEKD